MYCWKYYYVNICSIVKVTEDQSYCLSSCSGQLPTQIIIIIIIIKYSRSVGIIQYIASNVL